MGRVGKPLLLSGYLALVILFIYLGQTIPADSAAAIVVGLLFLGTLTLGAGTVLRVLVFNRE